MILFEVVAHDVVDLFGLDDLGDMLHQRTEFMHVHGVEKHVLLVADEVGVVGAAFGGTAVVVEVADIEVDSADPVDVFFQFNRLHDSLV